MLEAQGGTGVATYADSLRAAQQALTTRALLLTDRDDGNGRWRRRLAALSPHARHADADGQGFIGRDLFRLAQVHFDLWGRLLAVRVPGPPGIMHWSYPLPLRLIGWRNVYTVHDAIPLTRPDLSPIDPARHRRLLARIAERAAAMVTVSEAARAEIVAAIGIAPDRIVDCSQPVDVGAAGPLPAGLEAGRYLLVTGSVEPRKNIAAILSAYRASGIALPLVIAGPDGWRADECLATFPATPGAIRLPYLPREVVIALMANARALLMPSLAEGFGLPVIEAMTLGTPVVTSDRGALAEVAGGAALPVDPGDVGALADAIRRIAADDALHARMAAAGRANAARFGADAFAARLSGLYDRLIAPALSAAYRP